MKCNAPFDHDPSYRILKCDLPKGHSGWHERATTLWRNEDPGEVEQKAREAREPVPFQKLRKGSEVISIG